MGEEEVDKNLVVVLTWLTVDQELQLPIGFQGDNTQGSMGEEEVDKNLVVMEEAIVNRAPGR